jgi:hypothetical protein
MLRRHLCSQITFKFMLKVLGKWSWISIYFNFVRSIWLTMLLVFVDCRSKKDLRIGKIFQSMMSCLRKKHHFKLIWRIVVPTLPSVLFVNRWKIWYPKFAKNNARAKKHEMKLWKHNIHQESCRWIYHTWRVNQSNPKRSTFVSSMTRWTNPKLFFLNLLWKTKWLLIWVNSLSLWLVMIAHGHGNEALLNSPTSFGQMIQILWLGLYSNYFKPWKRNLLMNPGLSLNMNHKMHSFKDWCMEVFIVRLYWKHKRISLVLSRCFFKWTIVWKITKIVTCLHFCLS